MLLTVMCIIAENKDFGLDHQTISVHEKQKNPGINVI